MTTLRYLAALALVLLGVCSGFLWRNRGPITSAVAALFGIWYASYLPSRAVAFIIMSYFCLELGKAIGKRG